jgi:DNA-binding MarR family transcriptional regulator
MEDVIRELGYLVLGSRLRRIGEQLQSATQNYLSGMDIGVPAPQLPILAALDRLGPLTVGELSQALRVTQPGVSRMVNKLRKAGFVASKCVTGDRRIRRISLSARGRRLVDTSKLAVWPVIDAALKKQCDGLSGSLLNQLTLLEDALSHGFFESTLSRMHTENHDNGSA